MSNVGFALEGAWKVLAAGLILGAGLPALFALGIRALAWGAGGDAEVPAAPPRPAGKVLAYGLFAVVVLGVLLGITFIVASGFGKTISFDHLYPTIVDK
ncbi:hypothetical protein JIG36_38270 [Actinoplanes sp. LDG1-06]|uniref:Uncharacterized protein n=1 Tax=Paractinoplanes ovalisporus TaxID=2810368 RepID=A0ABS2ANI4_9ACTN|nr:hypothetical protein [Actinoplanes ovalisporus]MBM2621365.1 hypothetical protein [Actinoplanes ovalisporus]